MTKVCICQICTCGRHRCPHHPTGVIHKGDKVCLLSEYKNKYPAHPIDLRKSCKPEYQPIQSDEPLNDKTTNRTDYVRHQVGKPYLHMQDAYVRPEGNMDHMTSYKKDYIPKPFQPAKAVRRDMQRRVPGKFEGMPTYKSDYRKWALQQTDKITHDPGYQAPTDPFQGASSYNTDYLPHKQAVRSSMKPMEQHRDTGPFDGQTGYRQEYVKHLLPRREAREAPKWSPNKAPLDGMSNYRKDYTAKQGEKMPSCKPDGGAYQSDAPFEDGTTQRTDYKKWPVDRPQLREPDSYMKPQGDVDYHTTTHTDYNRKPIAPTKAKRPNSRRGVPGKFDGNTNYKHDFRKWPIKPVKQQARVEYQAPEAPFEGRSNYTDNYHRHAQAVRASMKPTEATQLSDQPFDGRTGYRDEYVKHPFEERVRREAPKWQPNAAKLDDMTNYMKDYTPKDMVKQMSCRPDNAAYQSDAPFDAGTTNRDDYVKWPMNKPTIHEPDQYIKPVGDMEFNTTTNTDYTKKPIVMVTAKRPTGRMGKPGKFDGRTNYSQDFRKWALDDRPKAMMQPEYVPPDAPFVGSTNYHDNYHAHKQQPPKSMKPNDAGHVSDAPFEGGTEYRQEFVKKAVPPCPAGVLETERAQYVYTEQDRTGHKWYKPLSANVADLQLRNNMGNATMNRQLTALSVA